MKMPIINIAGTKCWYNDQGELHRDGGSAQIQSDGSKVWYQNGLIQNDFGPAIITAFGSKYWYVNDYFYSEDEFLQYKMFNFINNK